MGTFGGCYPAITRVASWDVSAADSWRCWYSCITRWSRSRTARLARDRIPADGVVQKIGTKLSYCLRYPAAGRRRIAWLGWAPLRCLSDGQGGPGVDQGVRLPWRVR